MQPSIVVVQQDLVDLKPSLLRWRNREFSGTLYAEIHRCIRGVCVCACVCMCVCVYIYIPNITEYRIDEYVCPYV
jgi:hypothetical protein